MKRESFHKDRERMKREKREKGGCVYKDIKIKKQRQMLGFEDLKQKKERDSKLELELELELERASLRKAFVRRGEKTQT